MSELAIILLKDQFDKTFKAFVGLFVMTAFIGSGIYTGNAILWLLAGIVAFLSLSTTAAIIMTAFVVWGYFSNGGVGAWVAVGLAAFLMVCMLYMLYGDYKKMTVF